MSIKWLQEWTEEPSTQKRFKELTGGTFFALKAFAEWLDTRNPILHGAEPEHWRVICGHSDEDIPGVVDAISEL